MLDCRPVQRPDQLELDVVGWQVLEQPSALPEQDRYQLQLHLVPVLLGQGRRLFDDMPPDLVELELLRDGDGPGGQHLRYRVRAEG